MPRATSARAAFDRYGGQARTFLRVMAFSQPAVVHVKQTDRYGRLVARVIVAGKDVSEEMVRAGLAWHYLEPSSDPRLAALEKEARAKRVGLWADRSPVPPWVARRAGAARPLPPAAGAVPTSPTPGARPQAPSAYHGNVKSHVYHVPGCADYDCQLPAGVCISRGGRGGRLSAARRVRESTAVKSPALSPKPSALSLHE
ncbi:MAG: thermonuclease family protein [Bacteroidales bacterium]